MKVGSKLLHDRALRWLPEEVGGCRVATDTCKDIPRKTSQAVPHLFAPFLYLQTMPCANPHRHSAKRPIPRPFPAPRRRTFGMHRTGYRMMPCATARKQGGRPIPCGKGPVGTYRDGSLAPDMRSRSSVRLPQAHEKPWQRLAPQCWLAYPEAMHDTSNPTPAGRPCDMAGTGNAAGDDAGNVAGTIVVPSPLQPSGNASDNAVEDAAGAPSTEAPATPARVAASPKDAEGAPPASADKDTDDGPDEAAARARFPRGLHQPAGSFRFSADALLLASFAGGTAARSFADLGTGCGVVGLALLLGSSRLSGVGIEQDAALVNAARANAHRLGLSTRFTVHHADLTRLCARPPCDAHACDSTRRDTGGASLASPTHGAPAQAGNITLRHGAHPDDDTAASRPADDADAPLERDGLAARLRGTCDLVVANPPYRIPGTGRPAATPARNAALFETKGTLAAFIGAAALLLRTRGRFACVYGAARLSALLTALADAGLEAKRLRCVHSRVTGPAVLVLVEAMRGARPGLVVEPPLILYEGEGETTTLTADALRFCPWLACNARGMK
ncbi:hypothetical protein DVU_0452 [Nitratidesulfovibrio vulgaris str. Hildenborough]|uniref:Uncharacterized protein n=2 Tax=Nitratidesulfovibrio vulgaris TaxID=881 RepID=Q72EW6_NITV2|nr:hypothetical protein DVU_0452 [Nitratidesulfovibrio vulgaris str. Hildenborough]